MATLSGLRRWFWLHCWQWLLCICVISMIILYFQAMAAIFTVPGAIVITFVFGYFAVKFIMRAITFPGSLFLWKKSTESVYIRCLAESIQGHTTLLTEFLRLVVFERMASTSESQNSKLRTELKNGAASAEALAGSRALYLAMAEIRRVAAVLTVQNAMRGDDVFPEVETAFIGDFLAVYTLLNEIDAFLLLKVPEPKVDDVSRVLTNINGVRFTVQEESGHSKQMKVKSTILTLLSLPLPRKICHRITKFGLRVRAGSDAADHQLPSQPITLTTNKVGNPLSHSSITVDKEIAKLQSCINLLEKIKPFLDELADPVHLRFMNCVSWIRNYCKETCLGSFSYLRAELVYFSGAILATVPTKDNCSLDGVFFPADKAAFRTALTYGRYGAATSTESVRSPRLIGSGNTVAMNVVASDTTTAALSIFFKPTTTINGSSSVSSGVARTLSTTVIERSRDAHELELAPASTLFGSPTYDERSVQSSVHHQNGSTSTSTPTDTRSKLLLRNRYNCSASSNELITGCSAQLADENCPAVDGRLPFGVCPEDLYFCNKLLEDIPGLDLSSIGPTVIYYNTNASFYEISYRQEAWLHFYLQRGVNVFMCNFRGFSRSTGNVSPHNLRADAAQIYEYLRGFGCGPIGVHGRSVGGVCATHVAASPGADDIQWLFADRTFSSLSKAASVLLGNWTRPILKCMRHDVDNVEPFLRSRAYKISSCDPGDTIVPLSASLHTGVSVAVVGNPILNNRQNKKEHFLRKLYYLFKRRPSVGVAQHARGPRLVCDQNRIPEETVPALTTKRSMDDGIESRDDANTHSQYLCNGVPLEPRGQTLKLNDDFVRELLDAWHFLELITAPPDDSLNILIKLLPRVKRRESSISGLRAADASTTPICHLENANSLCLEICSSHSRCSSSTTESRMAAVGCTHEQQRNNDSPDDLSTAVFEVNKLFSQHLIQILRILGDGFNASGQSFENAVTSDAPYVMRKASLAAFLANLQTWGCEARGTAVACTINGVADAATANELSGSPATSAQSLEAFSAERTSLQNLCPSAIDGHTRGVRSGTQISADVKHMGLQCALRPAEIFSYWMRYNSRVILHRCRENFVRMHMEFRSDVFKFLSASYSAKVGACKTDSSSCSTCTVGICEMHSTITSSTTTCASTASCNGNSSCRGVKSPRSDSSDSKLHRWQRQPATTASLECMEALTMAVLGSLTTLQDFLQLLHSHFQRADWLRATQDTARSAGCGDSLGECTGMHHADVCTRRARNVKSDHDVGYIVTVDCGHNGNFSHEDLLVVDFHLAQSGLVAPRNCHPKTVAILEAAKNYV
eukprot:Lankesteria_metandrocarpae@DN4220_c0_g1_i2.p1